MVATLDQLLTQLKSPQYTYSNSLLGSATDKAALLADAVVRYQKEQRAEPYLRDLQRNSAAWATANAQQKQALNTQNNKIRQAYIASGGSPIDLPETYWGSNPTKGFQTGTKAFDPGYLGDNLSRGQKQKDAELTGMYDGSKTWPRQFQEWGLINEGRQIDNQSRQVDLAGDANSLGWAQLGWDKDKFGQEQQAATASSIVALQLAALQNPTDLKQYLFNNGEKLRNEEGLNSQVLAGILAAILGKKEDPLTGLEEGK